MKGARASHRLSRVLASAALAAFAPLSFAQESPLQGFDAYVAEALKAWQVPGCAIAVVKDDRVVLAKGYGVRTAGKSDPVGPETLFAIASNSKAFTATAIAMLVAEGKLGWNDLVTERLPGFRLMDWEATKRLKVIDLLCHRSGLGTWAGDLMWFGSKLTRAEVVQRIRYVPPEFDYGTGYGYSNLMFVAAGELIPQVDGRSWEQFLLERLFQPLGMTRTNTSVTALAGDPDVATPHTLVRGPLEQVPYLDVSNSGPAGAINSCAKDLASWLRFQLAEGRFDGQKVAPAAAVEMLRQPQNLQRVSPFARSLNPSTHLAAYGLGFGLADYQGRLKVEHTGGLNGMYSIVALIPEAELGVAVVTNLDEHDLTHALALHVIDAYLGVPAQDWSQRYLKAKRGQNAERAAAARRGVSKRVPNTRPSHEPKDYTGTFANQLYGEATVAIEGDQMTIRLSQHANTGVLSHWHYDVFLATWDDVVWHESAVRFESDIEGRIGALSLKIRPEWIDPLEYRFERK